MSLTVVLDDDTQTRLREWAASRDRSLSWAVRTILAGFFEAEDGGR